MKLPDFWWLPFGKVPEISPAEFKSWLKAGKPVQVVDSRSGLEFRQGTIDGAQHAPVTELPGSLERLQLDPSVPVVVLCLSGHRSLPGTRWLRSHGFEAYSLQGGLMAWKSAGFGMESAD